MLKLPCVLLLRRSFPFVLHAWVGRRKPQFVLFHMKQQHSASKSKRKISHDPAHRPQNKAVSLPIHCEFMFRAPLQKSNFARRNAIARIIDNGGAPKHRAECAKIRCRTKKSGNGGWWVHAALPPNVQSVATHPPFRSCGGRKHRHMAGTPKGLVKNYSIAPQGKKPLCQTGIIRTRFSAADFRLNRVTRLANTGGY